MFKTTLKLLGFSGCLLLLMFCSEEPEMVFGSDFDFNCNSPLTICNRPDSIGVVFGAEDCDGGGISNLLECRNGTDFNSGDDDCAAAIRGKIDLCLLIQVDMEDVSKGYRQDHVMSQIDCDGGGLTNVEECIKGFNPLKENDIDQLNGQKNDDDIEAFLKNGAFIDQALVLTDTVGVIGVADGKEVWKTESGLIYIINTLGVGEIAMAEDSIVYKLESSYLQDGNQVPISTVDSETKVVKDLIFGMQEGLNFFPEGTSGKLIMPARLAYNQESIEGIPSYSVIILDLELTAIL